LTARFRRLMAVLLPLLSLHGPVAAASPLPFDWGYYLDMHHAAIDALIDWDGAEYKLTWWNSDWVEGPETDTYTVDVFFHEKDGCPENLLRTRRRVGSEAEAPVVEVHRCLALRARSRRPLDSFKPRDFVFAHEYLLTRLANLGGPYFRLLSREVELKTEKDFDLIVQLQEDDGCASRAAIVHANDVGGAKFETRCDDRRSAR
jgi:hypothetical protein